MLESMQSKIELLAYTWKCKFAKRKQQKDCNSKKTATAKHAELLAPPTNLLADVGGKDHRHNRAHGQRT